MLARFVALKGHAVRRACALAAVVVTTLSFSQSVLAGPGHSGDEGHSHDSPQAASTQSPRVVATSESFQLVGILKGGRLTIYLDSEPDNVPVTNAKIVVSAGGKPAEATPANDGTYVLAAGDWAKPGENEMQFSIAAAGKSDLLGGVLIVPGAAAGAAPKVAVSRMAHLVGHLPPLRHLVGGGLLLGLGIVIGLLFGRGRAPAAAAAVALICASAMFGSSAVAGPGHSGDEGHAHGPEAAAGLSDTASRLPDGSVFVPKPTQRLIEVRTGIVKMAEARRHVRVPGRVVAAPSGLIVDVALYDQADPERIRAAHAVAPSGATAEVKLAERGTEVRQNAVPVAFTVPASAPAALRVAGQRVTVILETGDLIKGVVLPRAAIVTAPNGQAVVFEHTEPEKFTPKAVVYEALDTARVIVRSGLADGEKIVLGAAGLINQIR